ncbi:MAG: ABC transporter ATP-binding protein [Verrucomicrobiota bacterium]
MSENAPSPPDASPSSERAIAPPPHPDLDPGEMRKHCFRLIHEVTSALGWRYRLWIPAAVGISAVHLLPQRFLQFFTEESVLLSETPASDFMRWLVLFGVAIALCLWIANVLEGILSEWFRLTVSIALRKSAVESLNRTRIDSIDSARRGDWMTRLTGDLYNAEEFITRSIPEQITNATLLLGAGALFFFYSGPIALIPLAAALLLGWINIVVQKRMGPTMAHAREIEGNVFQSMIETFEGLRTIRTFGGERFTFERIEAQLNHLFSAGMRITRSMAMIMGANELVSHLVITGILTLIAYQIQGEALTATDALVYPFFINLFLGAAKGLVASAYDWNRFFIEGGRLASLVYDEDKKELEQSVIFGDLESSVSRVQKLRGNGITLSYGNQPPILQDCHVEIERGEIVALMGPSGCGKSTLTECLAGLRQANEGEFSIVMKDGPEFRFPQSPPFLAAFVEQQPYLFVDSIRNNILMGRSEVTDAKIARSLEELGLSQLVTARGGLDHILEDRGRNLSVGQQYRLALCRALISDRPFLFMDEPFAALDVDSVDLVMETIREEANRGTGILLVTHLLPDTLGVDKLLRLPVAPQA